MRGRAIDYNVRRELGFLVFFAAFAEVLCALCGKGPDFSGHIKNHYRKER